MHSTHTFTFLVAGGRVLQGGPLRWAEVVWCLRRAAAAAFSSIRCHKESSSALANFSKELFRAHVRAAKTQVAANAAAAAVHLAEAHSAGKGPNTTPPKYLGGDR